MRCLRVAWVAGSVSGVISRIRVSQIRVSVFRRGRGVRGMVRGYAIVRAGLSYRNKFKHLEEVHSKVFPGGHAKRTVHTAPRMSCCEFNLLVPRSRK